jgi:hypothetical protein
VISYRQRHSHQAPGKDGLYIPVEMLLVYLCAPDRIRMRTVHREPECVAATGLGLLACDAYTTISF